MNRREFVKAAVALAGTLGVSGAIKAGGQAEKVFLNHWIAREDPSDIAQLRGAFLAENKAVYAYGLGLKSGLLKGATKEYAKLFQLNHQGHAEALKSAIQSLGGQVPEIPGTFDFETVKLSTPADIARFAYGLEKGAARAYLNGVESLQEAKLKAAAAQIMADEIVHATTWHNLIQGNHPLLPGYGELFLTKA